MAAKETRGIALFTLLSVNQTAVCLGAVVHMDIFVCESSRGIHNNSFTIQAFLVAINNRVVLTRINISRNGPLGQLLCICAQAPQAPATINFILLIAGIGCISIATSPSVAQIISRFIDNFTTENTFTSVNFLTVIIIIISDSVPICYSSHANRSTMIKPASRISNLD